MLAVGGQAGGNRVGERDGQRHQLRRFVRRKAKHQALITRALLRCAGNATVNVLRLDTKQVRDADPVGVERFVRIGVANFTDGVAHHSVNRDPGKGFDFAGHDHLAVLA